MYQSHPQVYLFPAGMNIECWEADWEEVASLSTSE